MIIGIDASRANKDNKTGTEWYSYNVIQKLKYLINQNDQVILYSKEKLKGDLAKLPDNFSNKVLNWPPKFLWTQIRLSFEIILNKPDVLFIPAHTIPILSPKKTITTIHDVGFENFSALYSQKPIGPSNPIIRFIYGLFFRIITFGKYKNNELDYHRWSVRLAIKKAAKIITISEFSVSEIMKYFNVNRNKIFNVYNSYNPIYKVEDNIKKINWIKDKYNIVGKYILYIGRLEEKKNTPNLVEAFGIFKKKYNNDYKLVLVGQPGYGYDKIKKIINQYDIRDSILELGWVDHQDLPILMNGADIFCFPSVYEGFGMPILEAMACNTPVITSNFGAMKEIAKNAALLTDTKNPLNIANAMQELATNKQLRDKLVVLGNERIKQFSWDKTATFIKDIIYSLK